MMDQTVAVNKTVLENGLTVVSEHIPAVRSISIGIYVKTGSRHENKDTNGIAHLLEHMVFKGTKNYSAIQIARSMENLGGSLNAYTSREITVYYVHILDTHLELSVKILAELALKPLLRENDLIKEKRVIQEEISSVKDTPEEYIIDLFHEKLFPNHPLGRPILGTTETLNGIDKNNLNEFWYNHYNPPNMVLSVAGNIDHQKVIKLVRKYFDSTNTGKTSSEYQFPGIKAEKGKSFNFSEPVNQTHICVGTDCFSFLDERKYDLIAINTYLGGGMSSRLFQIIREKRGLAYSVYSFLDFFMDSGVFGFYLGTEKSQAKKAIDLMMTEIKRVKTILLSASAVKSLKEQLKGSYLLGLESTGRRMGRMAKNEIFFKRYIPDEEIIDKINAITAESLLQTAGQIFTDNALNTITFIPNKRV